MSAKKRGLGRGLESLLGAGPVDENGDNTGDELVDISVGRLHSGAFQPRRDFDQTALDALADSIRTQGVVQPIVVRPSDDGRFEIIAGERRWRAAQQVGLKTVPAVVRRMDERTAMAVALVENIQRADLNPLEEAEALRRLIDDCGLTHEQCAQAVGKSRVAVTHLLRLMDLDDDVKDLVRAGHLGLGHAKVLVGVDGERQSTIARRVVQNGLTVRQTEALVQAADAPAPERKPAPQRVELESSLSERIGLPVKLRADDRGRGRLTVAFSSAEEMEKLVKRLQS